MYLIEFINGNTAMSKKLKFRSNEYGDNYIKRDDEVVWDHTDNIKFIMRLGSPLCPEGGHSEKGKT